MKCTKCLIEKPVSEFEVRSDTGKHRKQCKQCRLIFRKSYYEKNREGWSDYTKNYTDEQIVNKKLKQKEYFQKTKDKFAERTKIWVKNNRDKVNLWEKQRRKQPYYKMREMLRSMIRRLNCNDKNKLGYDIFEFRNNIESKFKEGMTWENHGEWELDHIRPVISFFKDGISDPKLINALDNLQPLWKDENRKKSSKY